MAIIIPPPFLLKYMVGIEMFELKLSNVSGEAVFHLQGYNSGGEGVQRGGLGS